MLTSRQPREKLQCLYENLMSSNSHKTAVLKKKMNCKLELDNLKGRQRDVWQEVCLPGYRSSRSQVISRRLLSPYSRMSNIILILKRACFGLWVKEQGILHLKRVCFALWLIELEAR